MKLDGFKNLSIEEQEKISAGAGGGAIGGIISAVTSGISGLVNIADDVSDTVIKNKIVAKMDDVQKGEIELGKNGDLRLKWDSLSSSNDSPMPTVIF